MGTIKDKKEVNGPRKPNELVNSLGWLKSQ